MPEEHSHPQADARKPGSAVGVGDVDGGITDSTFAGRDSIGTQIVIQAPVGESRPRLAPEMLMLHNFDLRRLIAQCDAELRRRKNGLLGFLVPCDSSVLIEHLCKRVKRDRGRSRVEVKTTIVIKASHTSFDDAVLRITRLYKPAVRTKDIVFAVQLDADHIRPFWQRLRAECGGPFEHRLITLMAACVDEPERLPEIVPLPVPQFELYDVREWMVPVCESLNWPAEASDRFIDLVEQKCMLAGELHLELVYIYLETAIDILKQEPTPEVFFRELHERCPS